MVDRDMGCPPPRLGEPRESHIKQPRLRLHGQPQAQAKGILVALTGPNHESWSNKGAGSQNSSENKDVAFTWHFLYTCTSQRNERGAEQGGICSRGKLLIENFCKDLLIYFSSWLHTAFSTVKEGLLLLAVCGLLSLRPWAPGAPAAGAAVCGLRFVLHRLPGSMVVWDLPEPGIEPVSLKLQGAFLTTGLPGKPQLQIGMVKAFHICFSTCNPQLGFTWWLSCKEPACQCRIPRRRKWQPTPVFLPGESLEQRSLVGRSLWGCQRVRHYRETKHHQEPTAGGPFTKTGLSVVTQSIRRQHTQHTVQTQT